MYPAQFHFFCWFFAQPEWLPPGFCLVVAIDPGYRTEDSSKVGTRWYVNAAAAPILQRFENYYGASH
jgi:hypothetical protein